MALLRVTVLAAEGGIDGVGIDEAAVEHATSGMVAENAPPRAGLFYGVAHCSRVRIRMSS